MIRSFVILVTESLSSSLREYHFSTVVMNYYAQNQWIVIHTTLVIGSTGPVLFFLFSFFLFCIQLFINIS